MTLLTQPPGPVRAQEPPLFTVDNASWELYELLLRDVEGQNVRITYDNGRMVLMSPLPIHEKLKKLMAMLIESTAITLRIPVATLGSTTWKRQDIGKGLEADECYYVQNEAKVRSLREFDLTRDPAPDLAIEVDISYSPLDRPSIYAKLGVNEIWRHDGERVRFLALGADRTYTTIEVSQAFPMLTPDVIDRHLALLGTVSDTEIAGQFREWLLTARRA